VLNKTISVVLDFETRRKEFFLAIKQGHFKKALELIPPEPSARKTLLTSTGTPSGKNVMHWLLSYMALTQTTPKSLKSQLQKPQSDFYRIMDALKPFAINLATKPDCDGNTPIIMLQKLNPEVQKLILDFFALKLGSVEDNASVTYPFRNRLLWELIADGTIPIPTNPSILVIGAGWSDKVVVSADFNPALSSVEFKSGPTVAPYSPECYEFACVVPSGKFDVIDASPSTLDACSTLPATAYSAFSNAPELSEAMAKGESRLRGLGMVSINRKIESSLKWTARGLDSNSFPVDNGHYDFILASNILHYPIVEWITTQRGVSNQALRESGRLVIGNLIEKLKVGGTLAIDQGTCWGIADPEQKDMDLFAKFAEDISRSYSVRVQRLRQELTLSMGVQSEFLIFTRR